MGQYTPNTFSDGTAITASALNTEFAAIATEVNALDSNQFHSGTAIPNNALSKGNWFALTLKVDSVANGTSTIAGNRHDVVTVPHDATLISVDAVCIDVQDGTETVDIYLEDGSPATILSTPMIITADLTNISDNSPAVTAFSANDILSLRVDTGDGTEAFNDKLTVTLLFEPA